MEATRQPDAALATSDAQQYLTFTLGQEEYGIEILRVQEIKGYSAITPIPNTPPYIKGVMNLRGTVVPVVDLRVKFGMASAEYNRFTVVIVVTLETRVVGLVVDGVSDVLTIAGADVVPTPEMGDGIDTTFLTGMVRSSERLTALLAIDRLVGLRELEAAAA